MQLPLLPLLLVLLPLLAPAAGAGKTCWHWRCRHLSLESRSLQNLSADPCVDFYEYACGGYSRRAQYHPDFIYRLAKAFRAQRLPLLQNPKMQQVEQIDRQLFEMLATGRDDSSDELFSATRQFFANCVAWRLRRDIGAEGRSNESFRIFDDLLRRLLPPAGATTERLLANAVASGGSALVSVQPLRGLALYWLLHKTNESRSRLATAELWVPPITGLEAAWTVRALADELKKVPTAAGRLSIDGEAFHRVRRNVSWIVSEAESSNSSAECLQSLGLEHTTVLTVEKLQQLGECLQPDGNAFNWRLFFAELLRVDAQAASSLKISAQRPATAATLANFFKGEAPIGRRLTEEQSFFVADWLIGFGEFLPPLLRRLTRLAPYRIRRQLQPSGTSGADSCFTWTLSLLRPPLERRYLRSYDPRTFETFDELVSLLKRAMIDSVHRQAWMSNASRCAVKEKLETMRMSEKFEEVPQEKLHEIYSSFLRAISDNRRLGAKEPTRRFAKILTAALADAKAFDLQLVSGRREPNIFQDLSSLLPNPAYFNRDNRLILPLGLLSPPLFHPSLPTIANLANLGLVVGHEIAHGFDTRSWRLDKHGHPGPVFDNSTAEEFHRRVECLRRQRLSVNGPAAIANQTLDEDVSDVIGMSAIVGAWKLARRRQPLPMTLSKKQQLFLLAAQSLCEKSEPATLDAMANLVKHSPFRTRVLTFVLNSPAFAEAFACPRGSPMNPEEKCNFW